MEIMQKSKDGSTTNEQHYPWNDPFYHLRYPGPPLGSVADHIEEVNELTKKTIATNIIIPDSTPQAPYVMQVPHVEVLDRISLILKDCGFCSSGEGIDIGNLRPYKNVLFSEELPHKLDTQMGRMKSSMEMPCLENGKAKGKK
ncbi:hypothetical protein ACQ4PT_016014 [Festuca glaucescens]